jgi:hypothetical protein
LSVSGNTKTSIDENNKNIIHRYGKRKYSISENMEEKERKNKTSSQGETNANGTVVDNNK